MSCGLVVRSGLQGAVASGITAVLVPRHMLPLSTGKVDCCI